MMKYYANYKIYHEVKDGDICRKSIKGFNLSKQTGKYFYCI